MTPTFTLALLGIIVGIVWVAYINRRNSSALSERKLELAIRDEERAQMIDAQIKAIEKSLAEREKLVEDKKNAYEKKYGRTFSSGDDSDN